MGMKEKKKNFEKISKMADSNQNKFFNSANSQYFFTKILEIGPWVSIDAKDINVA